MKNLLNGQKISDQTFTKMNRVFFSCLYIISVSLFISALGCSHITRPDYLKKGFVNPPDSSRPGVYWYFMDGNLDREGITADLESMKKVGISYALFLEVNVGVPRGDVNFLGEEWQDLFRHAVREAERLGIRIIVGSGPGWAGSGGPWIKPEESMMHLVASDTTLTGPQIFNSKLEVPEPRKPFFGENTLTTELKEKRQNWYEDYRILAFPAPDNPAKLTDVDEKALYYRAPYTSQAGVVPFLLTNSNYADLPGEYIRKSQIVDLTNRMLDDGTLAWNVPPGRWTVLRFGIRNNGAVTRPAPVGGLGFESGKFDTASFNKHYNEYIGKLIRLVNPRKKSSEGGWTMVHIDSWEMGSQNWSHNFVDEFIKRRGYDPLLYLPTFMGYVVNNPEVSERFLWDIRQTSNELIAEYHAGWFREMAAINGFTLSIEPYDMNPGSDLDLGEKADVPMGEFWSDGYGFNSAYSCIEAVSVGHVTGKPVIAAEAFTSDSNEAWKLYPGLMKNQTDWALAMGINRFVFHTFAHKPFNDQLVPGMTMGPYGVHWDRKQTWWSMVKEYHDYLARCQYILSQGIPVADILYLNPEGAPVVFRPPASALTGTDFLPDKREYSFDGCSPSYLIDNASVSEGKIVFPGGASYSILVLPLIETITPGLASKIEQLLKDGAIVAGIQPKQSPSLSDYPECDAAVKKLTDGIWQGDTTPDMVPTKYFKGSMFITAKKQGLGKMAVDTGYTVFPSYSRIENILRSSNISPDFSSNSGNIRYNHRTLPDREIYFISNKTGVSITDTCYFRNGSDNIELWDPVSGEISKLYGASIENTGISIELSFDPWQSHIIVFYKSSILNKNNTAGSNVLFPEFRKVMELKGPWTITFNEQYGGPVQVISDTLADWTTSDDDSVKYYSGTAAYTILFDLPAKDGITDRKTLYLDLGTVKNIARVILNGKNLGVVWTAPWRIYIGRDVRQKNNRLEIQVANLWVNRLIGDEQKPWDGIENGNWPQWLTGKTPRTSGRYTFTTHRYYSKDDPLLPSGLLGPVVIQTDR